MTVAARVYVPDAVRDDVHRQVRDRMIRMFGGVTSFDARGSWLPDDGDPITEDVTVYESVTHGTDAIVSDDIAAVAQHVKRHSNEDSVMWEVRPVAKHGFE